MKLLYIIVLFCMLQHTSSNAQWNPSTFIKKSQIDKSSFLTIQPQKLNRNPTKGNSSGLRVAATCSPDTVEYPWVKTLSQDDWDIEFFDIQNNNRSPIVAGQYFPCPQPITITGFYFYAIKIDTAYKTPLNVTCSVYNAGADSTISLRLGTLEAPLASTQVAIDTAGLRSNIFRSYRSAVFAKPITVTRPFILAITNPSALYRVILLTNDYTDTTSFGPNIGKPRTPNGQRENLLSFTARFGDTPLTSYNAIDFDIDGDLLVAPYVTYDNTANFSLDKVSAAVGEPITFTNLSSPIATSKFYNIAPLVYEDDSSSFEWDFGNGSRNEYIRSRSFTRSYNAPGTYTISLTNIVYGYYYLQDSTRFCESNTITKQITITAPQGVAKAFDKNQITVYPNPAEDKIYLTSTLPGNNYFNATLTDIAGKVVLEQPLQLAQQSTLPVSGLLPGLYLLHLTGSEQTIIKQIMIK